MVYRVRLDMENGMKYCKACSAPIRFIKSVAGKYHVCEWEGAALKNSKPGQILVMLDGRIYHATESPPPAHLRQQIGFESHFAKCPSAGDFRKVASDEKVTLPASEKTSEARGTGTGRQDLPEQDN